MTTELSGLELRKALCAALNLVHGHYWMTGKPGSICRDCGVRYDSEELATEPCYDSLPALECDPADFWPDFEKWLRHVNITSKRQIYAGMQVYLTGSAYFQIIYNDDGTELANVKGATICEAGCRAWMRALQRIDRAPLP